MLLDIVLGERFSKANSVNMPVADCQVWTALGIYFLSPILNTVIKFNLFSVKSVFNSDRDINGKTVCS